MNANRKRKYMGSKSRSISPCRNRSSSRKHCKSYSRSPLGSRSTYSLSSSCSSYTSDPRYSRRTSPDDSSKVRCLGIFGLGSDINEDKIHEALGKYGRIEKINIIYDSISGKCRGYGFVYFKYYEDARKTKDLCSGIEIDGRKIRLDYSFTHRPYLISRRGNDDRGERCDRYDRREHSDRHGRRERSDRYDRRERSDRYDRRKRSDRCDLRERSVQHDRREHSDKYDRREHSDRHDCRERHYKSPKEQYEDYLHEQYRILKRREAMEEGESKSVMYDYFDYKSKGRSLSPRNFLSSIEL
ncbi:transformer-2 sex-determining protein-like [Aphis craccivora]|uniref:Transformer-2 sex-determining protein-like n=1 Tax=Aphis craccivora TaxID=307492 RepID=A0A6G0YP55_APHCR|nr:transformer-2 sex-determining protein-like [Aphis craccivora]